MHFSGKSACFDQKLSDRIWKILIREGVRAKLFSCGAGGQLGLEKLRFSRHVCARQVTALQESENLLFSLSFCSPL